MAWKRDDGCLITILSYILFSFFFFLYPKALPISSPSKDALSLYRFIVSSIYRWLD